MSTLENIYLAIDSIPISKVNVVNFLGIQIDSDLKWDIHINNIKSKISNVLVFCTNYNFLYPLQIFSHCIIL